MSSLVPQESSWSPQEASLFVLFVILPCNRASSAASLPLEVAFGIPSAAACGSVHRGLALITST
jgi:hypothetical protein